MNLNGSILDQHRTISLIVITGKQSLTLTVAKRYMIRV